MTYINIVSMISQRHTSYVLRTTYSVIFHTLLFKFLELRARENTTKENKDK